MPPRRARGSAPRPRRRTPREPSGRASSSPSGARIRAASLTRPQSHTYFAALDLVTKKPGDIPALLQAWTEAAARMTAGLTAKPLATDLTAPPGDSGEALGFSPARLTLTFGFGAGLFVKDGSDRYGLAARRPEALVDLPRFNGDQLVAKDSGGDLSIQACADDPQVAFHAVRQLVALAYDAATLRWTQSGFASSAGAQDTPRNLMGFRDGTRNPAPQPPKSLHHAVKSGKLPGLDEVVWVGAEGPDWMRGGSYVVVRKIRIALEHWDRTQTDFQEEIVGRHKYSGAPIGKKDEHDTPDFDAMDKEGNPVIAENAHVRLAAPESNDGAQILRRGYSYNDGVNFTAERWPPWRQAMEYDAGLLFVAYQRDVRTGFIKIFDTVAKLDAMNQFTTHIGSGVFACPRGVAKGEFIGQGLFSAA